MGTINIRNNHNRNNNSNNNNNNNSDTTTNDPTKRKREYDSDVNPDKHTDTTAPTPATAGGEEPEVAGVKRERLTEEEAKRLQEIEEREDNFERAVKEIGESMVDTTRYCRIDFWKMYERYSNFYEIYYDYYGMVNKIIYLLYRHLNKGNNEKPTLLPHDLTIEITNYDVFEPFPFDAVHHVLGKLIVVEGILVRRSKPLLITIGYRFVCKSCQIAFIRYVKPPYTVPGFRFKESDINVLRESLSDKSTQGAAVSEIIRCSRCHDTLDIETIDLPYYKLTIQEDLDTDTGRVTRTLDIFIEARRFDTIYEQDDIINKKHKQKADLGDKVRIVGVVLPSRPVIKSTPNASTTKSVLKLLVEMASASMTNNPLSLTATSLYSNIHTSSIYIEANSIEQVSKNNIQLTDVDITEIENIRKHYEEGDEALYRMLIRSFAPHIYGHEHIKEAILLQLALTGKEKLYNGMKRLNMHILLVGDPSTAKSQLLLYTARIAPVAIYTTGKGSTAAGLTAAIVKDEQTGRPTIAAGACVLASGGIACIDEFLTMRTEDRAVLHELMEQQFVSISKAGINVNLAAYTSILAACNPIKGQYDRYKPLTENVNIPLALLSRFDFIFVLQDNIDKNTDYNVAKAVINTLSFATETKDVGGGDDDNRILSEDMLKKWLVYCKRFKPKITEEVSAKITEYYIRLREKSSVTEGMLIKPRQLEAIGRMAIARARLLLRDTVTLDDFNAATRLYEAMLSEYIDMTTNKPDIGFITGTSVTERNKRELFIKVFSSLTKDSHEGAIGEDALIHELVKTGQFTEEAAKRYLEMAKREGLCYEIRSGYYKLVD